MVLFFEVLKIQVSVYILMEGEQVMGRRYNCGIGFLVVTKISLTNCGCGMVLFFEVLKIQVSVYILMEGELVMGPRSRCGMYFQKTRIIMQIKRGALKRRISYPGRIILGAGISIKDTLAMVLRFIFGI